MSGLDALQSVQFVTKNGKRIAVLSADDWEALIEWLETLEDVQTARQAFAELKAVFFPQTNPDGPKTSTANASTIAVEFTDGEVIRGLANYNPERNGFFLYPHDRSKNDRVFIVNSAIVSIEVEKL